MLKENIPPNIIDDEEDNILKEHAGYLGLNVEIPEIGTPAYQRLYDACAAYTQAVEYQHNSIVIKTNEKALFGSEKNRRSLHNKLCVMLLGTTWNDTSYENRKKISDFAVSVCGKEEYVGTF